MGDTGVGWIMLGRHGVGHVGVGWVWWVMKGGVHHEEVEWGGVGHTGVGWDGSCRGGVRWELQVTESRQATGYQICHKLGILSFF